MGWGGIDAIPMREGESRRDAVERVYKGGFSATWDGENVIVDWGTSDEKELGRVSRAEHQWMTKAQGMMEELWAGWELQDENKEPGRHWPWYQTFVHSVAPMWFKLSTSYINFDYVRSGITDREWRFWWRTVRRFAAESCVIFEPDENTIIATSLSARASRDRYYWL